MTIDEIWEKIRNESDDIKDMVLASLDGQLTVRFKQVVDWEINKLCIVDEELHSGFVGYGCLTIHEESWQELGFDKDPNLPLYREMVLVVDKLRAVTDTIYGTPGDCIEIEVDHSECSSQAVRDLVFKICDKIEESEFIDITDTTLSNLKKNRNFLQIRFPSVG